MAVCRKTLLEFRIPDRLYAKFNPQIWARCTKTTSTLRDARMA
jgi:hypothetical protein